MTQQQIDPNAVINALSEQLRRMAVEHAVALAAKDAEIAELQRQLVADMDEKEDSE